MIRRSQFKPAWWLTSPHLQTIVPNLLPRRRQVETVRERIVLEDGDFVDLDWTAPCDGPIVLILHGLGGSAKSNYVKGIVHQVVDRNWQGAVMHFRGCSGEPNLLAKGYHAGDTGDLDAVVKLIGQRFPTRPLLGIGFSLGGNVLLKWLGEVGERSPFAAAVAVSVPFDIGRTIKSMSTGISRFYQWWFMQGLRRKALSKVNFVDMPLDHKGFKKTKTIEEYDRLVTAPLNGVTDLQEYYDQASCLAYLENISTRTLILHAEDDPLLNELVYLKGSKHSENIMVEISEFGGHIGFIGGEYPWKPNYFLEQRIPEFLEEYLSKD